MGILTTREELQEKPIRELFTTVPVDEICQCSVLDPLCDESPPRGFVYGVSNVAGRIKQLQNVRGPSEVL